jgi:hypothetical protein
LSAPKPTQVSVLYDRDKQNAATFTALGPCTVDQAKETTKAGMGGHGTRGIDHGPKVWTKVAPRFAFLRFCVLKNSSAQAAPV